MWFLCVLWHSFCSSSSGCPDLEGAGVGRAKTCTVRGKEVFRLHSRIKISLLNKYHFFKVAALLLQTLRTSFKLGSASLPKGNHLNRQFKWQKWCTSVKSKSARLTNNCYHVWLIYVPTQQMAVLGNRSSHRVWCKCESIYCIVRINEVIPGHHGKKISCTYIYSGTLGEQHY